MSRGLAVLLVLAALAILVARSSCPSSSLAQADGVIQGQVINGTAGGDSVADVVVVLHQDVNGRHIDLETTTDMTGRFRFDGIALSPNVFYGVSVTYQGGLYGLDLRFDNLPDHVELTVYEATNIPDVLTTNLSSVLFAGVDSTTQTISSLEIVSVVNASDRSYVPGADPMKLLRFSLPPGALDLQVESDLMDADLIQVDRGFALTGAVPPGEHQIMFAYTFPYEGTDFTFTMSLPFGSRQLRVLIPTNGIHLASTQMAPPQQVTIGNRTYQLLSDSDLPRGARIAVHLTGLPIASFQDRAAEMASGIQYQYVAPMALGLLAMLVVIYATILRKRRAGAVAVEQVIVADLDDRGALLQALVKLDQDLEAGRVVLEDYQRGRARLMHRLQALSKSSLQDRTIEGESAKADGWEEERS